MSTSPIKSQAMKLREKGYVYAQISKELGVPKSTVYSWVAHIQLSENQTHMLRSYQLAKRRDTITRLAEIRKARTFEQEVELRIQARNIVDDQTLTLNNKKVICAVMFWCEGGKDISSGVKFINSDPLMISSFLKLLRECFTIEESKLRALIHLHEYHDASKQLSYWSGITGIPVTQFHKPFLKPNTGKNIHLGYPGCVSVRYGDVRLGKLLKMIYSEFGKTI